jgi:hypothetical protein
MRKNLKIHFLILVFLAGLVLTAGSVLAAGKKPRGFFNRAAHCIGHACRFVVSVPDRLTHPLGPFLGPLAAEFLTAGISPGSNLGRLLQNARRTDKFIKDVETQKQIVGQVRQAYRDQAARVKADSDKIRSYRQQLGEKLISGEITLTDYQNQIVSLDRVADIYDKTSEQLYQAADKFNNKNVIKMVGLGMLDQFINKVRGAIVFNAVNELNRLIDPAVIQTLVATNNRDFDRLLDMIFSGDISRIISDPVNKDISIDELKNKIRNDIKQILKDNNGRFGANFRNQLTALINHRLNELRQTVKNLPPVPSEATNSAAVTDTPGGTSPPAASDSQCPSGYRWDRMSGVGCVQINCTSDKIANAHWGYVGDCICGSAGSIAEKPDDPNRRCTYPHTYAPCPDCVFKCVKYTEECPPPPNQ